MLSWNEFNRVRARRIGMRMLELEHGSGKRVGNLTPPPKRWPSFRMRLTKAYQCGEKEKAELGASGIMSTRKIWIVRTLAAIGLAFSFGVATANALEPFEARQNPWWTIDETRIGIFKQAIDDAPGEGGPAVNLEVLFGRLPGGYSNWIVNYFMTPRLHLGTTLAFGKTSEFYWGATWDFKLTDRLFFEASFGGAAHDGPLEERHVASYGCVVNFRESASLGFALSENWRVLATVDHMSNAGLCDTNRGLTNAGLRLGYKW